MPHRPWIAVAFVFMSTTAAVAQGCENLDPTAPGDASRAFECVSKLDAELVAAKADIARLESAISGLEELENALERVSARLTGLSSVVSDFDFDADMARVAGRVNALEGNVETLQTRASRANGVPAIGQHQDTRAIVAYTSEKGERTCPPGWKPFEDAKDRFILGAGNKYQVVGSLGGAETVTLEERHMPGHDHGGETGPQTSVPFLYNARDDFVLGFDQGGAPDVNGSNDYREHVHPIEPAGGDEPHENMPPWIALYYCIKE